MTYVNQPRILAFFVHVLYFRLLIQSVTEQIINTTCVFGKYWRTLSPKGNAPCVKNALICYVMMSVALSILGILLKPMLFRSLTCSSSAGSHGII